MVFKEAKREEDEKGKIYDLFKFLGGAQWCDCLPKTPQSNCLAALRVSLQRYLDQLLRPAGIADLLEGFPISC